MSAFRSVTTAARSAARAELGAGQAATSAARSSASATKSVSAARLSSMSATSKLAMRVAADQEKAAKAGATAEIREIKRVASAREHVFQIQQRHMAAEARAAGKIADSRRNAIGRGADSAAGSVLGFIKGGAIAAGGVSAALIGSAARESMKLGELAARISINARGAGEKGVDPNVLRREFEATAIATPGQSATDIAEAVSKFVSLTGDLETARKGQSTFATVASATGANVGDVAEAAASLSSQFKINTPEKMQEVLSALTYQGKGGAFELKDAAAQFQGLAASGASFGIEQSVNGVRTLGGLTQVARGGTQSAEEASTSVQGILTMLKTNGDLLKKEGVDVYSRDANGKATGTRNLTDVLVDSISKVGGSNLDDKNSKLSSIFGKIGIKGLNPLIGTFQSAYQGAKGSDNERLAIATKAVRDQMEKAINVTGTYADVQADAASAQQSSSATLSGAWEGLKASVSEQLTPSLVALVPKIADLAPSLGRAIEMVALFADGLFGLISFLEEKGIIEKSEKGTKGGADEALKANEAERAKILSAGPVTPEEADRLAQLDEQDAIIKAKKEAAVKADQGEQSYYPLADMTEEEYAAKRLTLGDKDAQARAASRPGEAIEDTKAQKDLDARRHTEQVNKNAPGDEAAAAATEANKQLASAAKAATDALNKVAAAGQQGTIVPPGG